MMAYRAPTDALGREIRAGDVLWVPGRQSSSLWLHQRRVVAVDPPLRGWSNRDVPEEELVGRVKVRWEPGLVGGSWSQPDRPTRATYLECPERTVREVTGELADSVRANVDVAFEEASRQGDDTLYASDVYETVIEGLRAERILP